MTEPSTARTALRAAAVVEPVSLLVLLGNLATAHASGVAAAVGPLHGSAYLVGIGATWAAGCSRRARWLAWVPGVGALLAARQPGQLGPESTP